MKKPKPRKEWDICYLCLAVMTPIEPDHVHMCGEPFKIQKVVRVREVLTPRKKGKRRE